MTPQDTNNVRLVELDDAPYREYRKHLVRDYAADKVRAGAWSKSEAESRAAKDIDGLLPEGPATGHHFLYSVREDAAGAEVGIVWFALRDAGVGRSVWIYDIIIHENFRRKGYASRTLELSSRPGPKSSVLKAWSYTCSATTTGRRLSTRRWAIT